MKIIDRTPYQNDKGEINLLGQVRAALKFGPSWNAEVQAQKVVVDNLGRALERGFTLLRNVLLPGTGARIPLILIGPSGIYVLYVTNLTGMYVAKGDLWGTTERETFRSAPVNLLTRTARMARAVQVYLQRQRHKDSVTVEGVLLAADPGLHVESVRPIIRVVMRDALERFAVSLSQARGVLSIQSVQEIVDLIVNPKQVQATAQVPPAEPEPKPVVESKAEAEIPIYEVPEPKVEKAEPLSTSLGFDFQDETQTATPGASAAQPIGSKTPVAETAPRRTVLRSPSRRVSRSGFTRRQWLFLIAFGLIEVLILVSFAYLLWVSL